jgi:hypothetical protein
MIIIHADSDLSAKEVNQYVNNGADVFMLIYMEGCGPCNATRPEWAKLEDALKHQYKNNDKLVLATINSTIVGSINHIGDINGFPTILYLSNNGSKMEHFEDSSINDKQRNVDCFMNWIESHVGNVQSVSTHRDVLARITAKPRSRTRSRRTRSTRRKRRTRRSRRTRRN